MKNNTYNTNVMNGGDVNYVAVWNIRLLVVSPKQF